MRDDYEIPMAANGPSYRVSRRATGADLNTRRLVIVACGIGGALLILVGAWSLMGHRHVGIPVVEAAAGPIRVKPVNPGGLEIFVAEDSAGQDVKEAMAPAAEAPNPQALREQEVVPTPSSTPQVAAASSASPQAPQVLAPNALAPQASASQALVMPAPQLSGAPAAPAVPPVTARPTASSQPVPLSPVTSGAQVQLAALTSEQAAMTEWERLMRKMPDMFSGRRPAVTRTERDGKTYFRLRTGGFSDVAQATTFCQRLREKGTGCSLATF